MSPALGGGGCRTFVTAMFRNKKKGGRNICSKWLSMNEGVVRKNIQLDKFYGHEKIMEINYYLKLNASGKMRSTRRCPCWRLEGGGR
jgi:hypothetical protein